jgi:putative RecB family exonuclease
MNQELSQERPHLSHSQLQCYESCSLKYRLSYVDQLEPEFHPANLAFGASIHECVAAFLQSTLEGDPLKADQLLDVYRDCWRGYDGTVRFFNRSSEEKLLEKAGRLLTVYHDSWDPGTEILAVEQPFEFDLKDYLPEYPDLPLFKGVIDNVVTEGGSVIVVDLKTSSKKLSQFQVNGNEQLTAYSIGAASLGFEPDKYRLDVLVKTSSPDLVIYETERGEQDQARFLKKVSRIWKAIQTGIFYPKPDWYCASCQWQRYCENW